MLRQRQKNRTSRRGIALVMVLVLIVLVSLGAYAFTDLMLAQQAGTQTAGRRVQASAAVASGVEYLKDYLSQDPLTQVENGGHYDNPDYFADVVVDPESNLRFSVVSIAEDVYGEPSGIRYGLYDLGARINVNELVKSSAYQAARSDGSGEEGSGGEGDTGGEGQGGDDGGSGGGGGNLDGGDNGGGRGGGGGGDIDVGGGDNGGGAGGNNTGGGNSGGGAGGNAGGSGSSSEDAPGEEDAAGEPADPARDALMALPSMTEEIADSILDWIDEDDEPRPFGAEAQYYSYDGYEPRNGPIASLDELLMVNGVTPELLFGADRNHNGQIDDSEQDLASAMQTGISSMSRGWSAFLTVRSMDAPLQNEPIDVNQEDLEALYDEILTVDGMNQDIATYIVAYRQSGPYTPPEPSQDEGEDGGNQDGGNEAPPEPEQINGRTVDLTQEGSQTISSVLDLVGSMTQAKFDEDESTIVESPFGTDPSELSSILPDLMANFTTGEEAAAGRINLNHCNQVTLSSVPGMSEELVQSILGQQDPTGLSTDPNLQYPTWPLAYGLTTVEEMKGLLPLLSTTGGVFAAQIVATSDLPGGFARAEVVIDASDGTPQVVSWRDLTHLGPGFTTPSN